LGEQLNTTLLAPDGTLKRLANNPEPFEHLNQALAHFEKLSKTIAEGDGTLSRLINDGTVDRELGGLLKDLRSLVQKMEAEPKKYLHFTVF
jgi:phospholipid/cholesterol/gamma-HCH transport system substrate-binding protein